MERERSALSKAKRRGKAIEYNEAGQMDYVLGAQQRNIDRVKYGHKQEAIKKKTALADERKARRRELDKLVREHFPENVIVVDDDEREEETATRSEKSDMRFEDDTTVVTVETENVKTKNTPKKSIIQEKEEEEIVDMSDSVDQNVLPFEIAEELSYFNQADASEEEIPVVSKKTTKVDKKKSVQSKTSEKADKGKSLADIELQRKLKEFILEQEQNNAEYTKLRAKENKMKKEAQEQKARERLEKSIAGNARKAAEALALASPDTIKTEAKKKDVAEKIEKKTKVEKSEKHENIEKPADEVKKEKTKKVTRSAAEMENSEIETSINSPPAKKTKAERKAEAAKKAADLAVKLAKDIDAGPSHGPVRVVFDPITEEEAIVSQELDPMAQYLFAIPMPEHWEDNLQRKTELEARMENGDIDQEEYERQMNNSEQDDNTRDLTEMFGLGPSCMSGRFRKKPLSKKVDNSSNARKDRKQERLRKDENKTLRASDKTISSWGYDSDGDVSDDMTEFGANNKKRKAYERTKKHQKDKNHKDKNDKMKMHDKNGPYRLASNRFGRDSKFGGRDGTFGPNDNKGNVGAPRDSKYTKGGKKTDLSKVTRDGQALAAAKRAGYYFGDKSGSVTF